MTAGPRWVVAKGRFPGALDRGLRCLEKAPPSRLETSPQAFLGHLRSRYPEYYEDLEFVRFYDWQQGSEEELRVRARFAVCHTRPRARTRLGLYNAGWRVTKATGWYPYLTGRSLQRPRTRVHETSGGAAYLQAVLEQMGAGRPLSIRNMGAGDAATPSHGTHLRVELERGAVDLDLGFPGSAASSSEIAAKVALVTHAHADHAGGLREYLDAGGAAVCSSGTASILAGPDDVDAARAVAITPPCDVQLTGGATVRLLPGAHAAGSMMVALSHPDWGVLAYPGDYCFSNGYFQPGNAHWRGLVEGPALAKGGWLLIDGALVGREGPSDLRFGLDDLVRLLRPEHEEKRSVLFTAADADSLYALYLRLFKSFRVSGGWGSRLRSSPSGDRRFLASSRVLACLDAVYEQYERHEEGSYDAFLAAVMGSSRANAWETHRLYELESNAVGEVPPPVDIFVEAAMLGRVAEELPKQSLVVVVGRQDESFIEQVSDALGGSHRVVGLAGPDFSFHSRDEDVVTIIWECRRLGLRPVVFHNFPKRVRKRLRALGVDASEFDCLSPAPLELITGLEDQ